MPYRPTRVHPRQKRELTALQLYQLCTGHCFFVGEGLSAAALAPAWQSVRVPVLDVYATRVPGCRPWAWWILEAPASRRCLVGAHDCPQRDAVIAEHKQGRLYYGRPGVYACGRCWEETYESQPRYLRRHAALLLPGEARILPLDLAACDAWAVARYTDDHPHPWEHGGELAWCRAVLAGGV